MASNRYEELGREVTRKLSSALDRLRHVWDEIGLDSEQRRSRTDVVISHLNNLLEEMVTEEEGLRDRLLKNIQKYGADLLRLSRELNLSPYEPMSGLTNVQLEKDLRKKVAAWEQERRERVRRLTKLQEEDQQLCDIMCSTPYYIASGTVPSLKQLDELKSHIKGLSAEKERRYSLFASTKEKILKILDDLEQCPNTSFERELICEEDDSFLLTSDNMSALKSYYEGLERQQQENFAMSSRLRDHMETLWERIQLDEDERATFRTNHVGFKPKVIQEIKSEISRCEIIKLEKMGSVIENTRKELVSWWDKCYTDPMDRDLFKPFTADEYTEDILTRHEDEVERLKNYYETNKEMFDLVERWQTLFDKFMANQRRENDPNRYFNRGCNLLKEEKARKKVEKDLPKVQEDVSNRIREFEKGSGRDFLINGVQFTSYIQQQWDIFHNQKETEKVQRHQAKAKLMEEELRFGSRPATTPGKKRTGTTPAKTPNKRFRGEKGPQPISLLHSTLSSMGTSSVQSDSSSIKRPPRPTPRPITRPARRQMNDTNKTPTATTPGFNRTNRTNHTSVFSPYTTSRSTYKPKTPTAGGIYSSTRKVLADRNHTQQSNDTGFSQTTVSSAATVPTSKPDVANESSLDSVGQYQEFAKGLNQNGRPNCRSSVLPGSLPEPAYF